MLIAKERCLMLARARDGVLVANDGGGGAQRQRGGGVLHANEEGGYSMPTRRGGSMPSNTKEGVAQCPQGSAQLQGEGGCLMPTRGVFNAKEGGALINERGGVLNANDEG